MPYYSMSETGGCNRVLSAVRLGNQPKAKANYDVERLKHYSRMEAVAAEGIAEEGYTVLDAGPCPICKNGRCGHHIDIEETLFRLVGHLDRRVELLDGRTIPVEIKSLGPTSWELFEKKQFEEFMGYAYQECCYLEHEKVPGMYWVINRDSGKTLKYIVNDFKNEYNLIDKDGKPFEKLTLPITYSQIIDKLNLIELDVAENKLCDPEPNNDCFWCGFKYLCVDGKTKVPVFADSVENREAAEVYKAGLIAEKMAKQQKESAINTLLNFSKIAGNQSFRVNGISFSYHGQKTTDTTDKDLLGKLLHSYIITDDTGAKVSADDVLIKVTKRSKPWDSYTIKVIETPEK